MSKSLEQLEEAVGYKFQDQDLLRTALTHSSTKEKTNYERLEFLGDRVLGLVVSELLYVRFSDESEGDLAKRLASLVQGTTVAKLSNAISLGDYVVLSQAEKGAGGDKNENILADVYEALIGAIYLDGGLEPCRNLITAQWGGSLDMMVKPPLHPKTELQEWAQSKALPLPVYKIHAQTGPDHAPQFEIELSVQGYETITSQGRTRQEAEKKAARIFLERLGKIDDEE